MSVRCLHCGATNGDGADWCGQCFEPFVRRAVSPEPEVRPELATDVVIDAERAPARERPVGDGPPSTPMWSCPVCEGENPIAAEACATCGTPMIHAFGGGEPDEPTDESAVRRWSALPGGGHMKAGAGLIGGAVALVVAMAGGFGGALVGAARTRIVGLLILLVGMATWLLSAWDVERRLRTGSDWLLQPRLISGIAGLVMMLLLIGVLLAI